MDPFDAGRFWTPWRARPTTTVDCLPFHTQYADLLRSTETLAYLIRSYTVHEMTCAGLGHPGGSFSEAEFLAALYNYSLRQDPRDPKWAMRDIFYLSKSKVMPDNSPLATHRPSAVIAAPNRKPTIVRSPATGR